MRDIFKNYDTFLLLGLLLVVYLIFINVHKDYGISWDEAIQREHGIVTLDYINESCNNCIDQGNLSDTLLQEYKWRHYGTIFQVISQIAEEKLGYSDSSERFYVRHRIQLFFFTIALFCFFYLLKNRYKKRLLAFGGLLLLLSTPRILGHQFFNPKDAVFLSAYVIAISSLSYLMAHPKKWRYYVIHAFCTGLVIDVRILGLYIVPLTLLAMLLVNKGLQDFRSLLFRSAGYLGLSFLSMVAMWPLLWTKPFENLTNAFKAMSAFDWKGEVLLNGHYLLGYKLPPDYLIKWITVSTPLISLGLIVLGFLALFYILVKRGTDYKNESIQVSDEQWLSTSTDLVCFMAGVGPLLIVVILKSTLYDGWRQMQFVYPMFIYFIVYLIYQSYKSQLSYIRYIGNGILIFTILFQLYIIWKWHPLQQVYFNGLAKKPWVEHYEMDYWGSGFKHAYEEFSKTLAPGEKVTIVSNAYPGWESFLALDDSYKEQLQYEWVKDKQEIHVSNFRYRQELDNYKKKKPPFDEEVFLVKRDGQIIYGFYKISNKENISQ